MANIWVSEVELRDLLGAELAKTFVRLMGGQRLYIPQTANAEHHIARTLGLPAMRALCSAYPGETISLPSSRQRSTAKKQIASLLAEGHSQGSIARDCQVTHRYVESVVQKLRREQGSQQMSLWG